MTEPTLPPTSGPSQPETHAADLHSTQAPASSGCCGGSSHETPLTLFEPTPVAHAPAAGTPIACGSHHEIAHASHAHESHAHESHAHESHAHESHAHESHAGPHHLEVGHALAPVVHAQAPIGAVAHSPAVAAAEAPTAVATLAPVTVASEAAAELHGHAGSLTPLTDATAQDIEAALRSAQKARASQAVAQAARPRGSDLVARRVVLRRDRWDSLLKLTNALRAQRGIVATPAEVAAIVLDAGLNVILEESAHAHPPVASAPAPTIAPVEKAGGRRAGKASLPVAAPVTPAPVAAAPVAPVTEPVAGVPVAAASVTPVTPALIVKPRTFLAGEIAHIRKTVRGLPSARSIQRTLGLWLGANVAGATSLSVPIEDLRSLCREFKIYDTANFAQNMKKDAAFFAEVRDAQSGDRLGYDLTPRGRDAASGFRFEAKAPVIAKKAKPARASKKPVSSKQAKLSAKRRGR